MVSNMARDTSFQLDITAAGEQILQDMAADIVQQSAQAIKSRAERMAASLSKNPPTFELSSQVGTIRTGKRAFSTITANETGDAHQAYVAHQALAKAKDAGRV